MAHEFESGFFVKEPAWHQLGVVLGDSPKTSEEAIKAAGLDWTVVPKDVFILIDGKEVRFEGKRALVRDTDNQQLAIVSNVYRIIQNTEAFKFFDPAIENGMAHYETAGSLRHGQIIWVLADMKQTSEIQHGDPVKRYLLLTNNHGDHRACRILTTTVRVVCMNTLRMALLGGAEGTAGHVVRHQGNVTEQLVNIQNMLGLAQLQMEADDLVFKKMSTLELNSEMINDFLDALYPRADHMEAMRQSVERHRQHIMALTTSGTGANIGRPSLWTLYNAATEHIDYYAGGRARDRVQYALNGGGNDLRNRAFATAAQLAGAGD